MSSTPLSAGADAPFSRRVLLAVSTAFVLLGLGLYWQPVQLNGDFTTSYLTWQEMRFHDAPFHCNTVIDPADIARDQYRFLSWWSPGTYLGVALLEMTGLSLGAAIAAWLALACVAGFTGWRRLMLQLGFSDRVAGWSLVVMALGWHTLYPFRIYHGGETAIFALFPWFTLAVVSTPPGKWANFAVLLAVTFIGTMAKLSFLITAAALTGVLLFRIVRAHGLHLRTVWRGLPAGLGFVGGAALVQLVFLSKGASPGTAGLAPANEQMGGIAAIATAVGLPVKALFSLTSMGPRLDQFLGWPESSGRLFWLVVALALAAPLSLLAWRAPAEPAYRITLLTVGALTTASLGWLYFRHAAISDEDRHARLVALLLLPGLVAAWWTGSWVRRGLLGGAFAVTAAWGILSVAHHWAGGVQRGATGARGIAYWELDQRDVAALHAVDAALGNQPALWLTPIEEVSLEFPHRRIRSTAPLLEAARAQRTLRGWPGALLILVSAGADADAIAAALPVFAGCDVNGWRKLTVGRHQLFYYGTATLPLPAVQP
jgi:hypothetical protein